MSLHDSIDADARCTAEDCTEPVRLYDRDDADAARCPDHEESDR